MVPELRELDDPIARHLEAALEAAETGDARYHIREALQLRLGEQSDADASR